MKISFNEDNMSFELNNREKTVGFIWISVETMIISLHSEEARDIRSCYDHNPAFNLCKKEKKVTLLNKYLCIEIQTNLKQVCIFCIT